MRIFSSVALLLWVLFLGIASANVIGEKRAETLASSSISTSNRTTTRGANAKLIETKTSSSLLATTTTSAPLARKSSTTTSSTAKVTQLGPAQDAKAAAAKSSTSGPTGNFCRVFVQQCYKIALDDQIGEVTVAHSCQRNGDRSSASFTYSCTRGSENLTAAVLKAMGWAYHAPGTTTTIENIRIETRQVEDVFTEFDRTTELTTFTDATVTNTRPTELIDVKTATVPATTTTSTTIIPYELTLTMSVPLVRLIPTTLTVFTSTQTDVFIGQGEIPTYQVVVREVAEGSEGLERRAPSTFCLAYKIACENECMRVSSRVKDWICSGGASTGYTYNLGCKCRNGKSETQHALEAVAEDRKVASVTVLGTSTTFLTSSRTTTIPTTDRTNTRLVTKTTLLDVTTTRSTTTTASTGTTTEHTSVSSATATGLFVVFTTTTSRSTTRTAYVPTTTNIILAPTGFIHAFDETGTDLGGLGVTLGYAKVYEELPSRVQFMAVRDASTGLYKLARADSPGEALKQLTDTDEPVMKIGTNYSAPIYGTSSSYCAPRPGYPSSSEFCEAFIFSPIALDPSPGATDRTVNLRHIYFNPSGSSPATFSGHWARMDGGGLLFVIADKAVYARDFPTYHPVYVTLRFPFTT